MAKEAGSHDNVKDGVEDPQEEVDHDEEDGVVAELALDVGQAAARCGERQLENGEEPREDEPEHGAPPADRGHPPAEPAGGARDVEPPGDELHHGDECVGEEGAEVGGCGPAVAGAAQRPPKPAERDRLRAQLVSEGLGVLDVDEPLEEPPESSDAIYDE